MVITITTPNVTRGIAGCEATRQGLTVTDRQATDDGHHTRLVCEGDDETCLRVLAALDDPEGLFFAQQLAGVQ